LNDYKLESLANLTDQIKSSKFDYTPGETNRKLENLKKIGVTTPKPMTSFGNSGHSPHSPHVKSNTINSIVNNDPNLAKLSSTPPMKPQDGFNPIRLQPSTKI
jgi:hypothetical protein